MNNSGPGFAPPEEGGNAGPVDEVWTDADSDAAAREGWNLWEADGETQVQRYDDPESIPKVKIPHLEDDAAAWSLVVAGVRAGSSLHMKAFRLASSAERTLMTETTGQTSLSSVMTATTN